MLSSARESEQIPAVRVRSCQTKRAGRQIVCALAGGRLTKQRSELASVSRSVVSEAVVHEHVRLSSLLGRGPDLGHPVGQLVFVVEVAEPLDDRDSLLLPGLDATPVEADYRQPVGGHRGKRRDTAFQALWLVDHDQ